MRSRAAAIFTLLKCVERRLPASALLSVARAAREGCGELASHAEALGELAAGRADHGSVPVLRLFPLREHPWLTPLQARVVRLTLSIPKGWVASYKQLSDILGLQPRAVARALSANPYPVAYPCHRVVRSDGRLGGYLGSARLCWLKARLLLGEGVVVRGLRVSREHFTPSLPPLGRPP
ncbi:MAG: hypothetical protein DRJ56_05655 [Thermoprotei archaeon]|nr:MAG: hypothetical protein DRJ56_05655 [Thermoprotei archaeon]